MSCREVDARQFTEQPLLQIAGNVTIEKCVVTISALRFSNNVAECQQRFRQLRDG